MSGGCLGFLNHQQNEEMTHLEEKTSCDVNFHQLETPDTSNPVAPNYGTLRFSGIHIFFVMILHRDVWVKANLLQKSRSFKLTWRLCCKGIKTNKAIQSRRSWIVS